MGGTHMSFEALRDITDDLRRYEVQPDEDGNYIAILPPDPYGAGLRGAADHASATVASTADVSIPLNRKQRRAQQRWARTVQKARRRQGRSG